jgi:hypothetical protein
MRALFHLVLLLTFLVVPTACYQSPKYQTLRDAYPPGTVVDPSALTGEKAFDSGPYEDQPVRISLVGYSEPSSYLRSGERLVILVEGEYAVYLFLDAENRVVRSEVVGS